MANPDVQILTKDIWTKIATNVTTGNVYNMSATTNYLQTFRLTDEAAPINNDDAVRAFTNRNDNLWDNISSSDPIDVYLKPLEQDGKIRLDI